MPADCLSEPLPLPCGAVLPNRIVKAAMTELLADDLSGEPTFALMTLYARWAASGAGMLLTGNVAIAADGRPSRGDVVVCDDRFLPQLSRWAEVAQGGGAQLWMQLNHAGRQSPRRATRHPIAPSAVPLSGFFGSFARPRAVEPHEIDRLIASFARAAEVAKQAGFSGVQIHSAHGYLASQFLSPHTNRRTDAWGGDATRRMRFLLETVRAVRAAVGAQFPIAVKLNSADFQRGGFTEEESMEVVSALSRENIDLLEISGGNYENPEMFARGSSSRQREAYFLDYAEKVRTVATMPLLLTGGFRSAAAMRAAVRSGAVDAIGLARPLAIEPDLPARILDGTADRAATAVPRVGIKMLDSLLQSAWFGQQLRRMASGRDPDPGLGKLGAIISSYRKTYAFNPFKLGGSQPAAEPLAQSSAP
jgi:2,4-dienoyl-CoA reductase-like NADH-dependent reductase (Old Yellow Enzyme family)